MVLAHWQRTFTDTAGNVQPSISIEVRNESTGALAAIYTDSAGTTAKDNPFTTDAFGFGDFYAADGRYRIVAPDIDWRNEELLTFENLQAAVDNAETYSQAAALNAGVYNDTTDGLAATVDGDYFSVPAAAGDDYLTLYRNDAGVATEIDTYPNKQAIDTVTSALNSRVISVSSRTAMKAYDVPAGTQFSLEEGGRSGTFVVKSGTPPSDPQEGRYVVLSNGNYAERIVSGPITFRHYGAVGDGITPDKLAVAAALATGEDCDGEGEQFTYLLEGSVSFEEGQKVTNFNFKKGANGPVLSNLPEGSQAVNGTIQGESASYTGNGVEITSGDNQRIKNVDILDTAGHPVEVTGAFAQKAEFDGGVWSSATADTQSIKFSDTGFAAGDILINDIFCSGQKLAYLGARQNIQITSCNMTGLTYTANCAKVSVVGCRLAILGGTMEVLGSNHAVNGNTVAGDIELGVGANFCEIGPNSMDGDVIDNSGLKTNTIVERRSTNRAWVNFDGTGASPAVQGSYGIDSVSKVSTGVYDVTLNSAFTQTGFCITTSGHPSNSAGTIGDFSVNAFVFGGDVVRVTTLLNGALSDFKTVCVNVFGNR